MSGDAASAGAQRPHKSDEGRRAPLKPGSTGPGADTWPREPRSAARRAPARCGGEGEGTYLDDLLLLLLLRLLAAPGLSLFLGGHRGGGGHRADCDADGYRRGVRQLGGSRKTQPPPQRTESDSLIRRPDVAFATARRRNALWGARRGARKWSCACAPAAPSQEGAWMRRGNWERQGVRRLLLGALATCLASSVISPASVVSSPRLYRPLV